MVPGEKDQKFTQSMAAAFFDLSPKAFRDKEIKGHFISVDNENLSQERQKTDNGGHKHRKYSLHEIRRIAYALRNQGKLSDRQLKIVIMRLDAFAEPLFIRKQRRSYLTFRNKDGK
jgi:hypothetical protein